MNQKQHGDSVSVYLRQMSRFRLLTREEEISLAEQAEAGERKVLSAILQTPTGADEVLQLAASPANGGGGDGANGAEKPLEEETLDAERQRRRRRELLAAATKLSKEVDRLKRARNMQRRATPSTRELAVLKR